MQLADATLLIADSSASMRQMLSTQLQANGISKVLQAPDGTRAWQMLQTEPVDLVLCDLSLRGMDGLDLLQAMRSHVTLAEIPLVLMSTGLDRASAEKAIRLRIADFLVKPFTTKRLLERLNRVFARDNGTSAPESGEATERATILVVDDTPENLQVIAGLFREDFKVKLAHNGERALAICHSDAPPDLILLDVMMPDMDGFEVARRLRDHPACENTPIMFVTAETDQLSRTRGLTLGAIDYIFKPIDPDLLKIRVSNLMHYVVYRKQLQTDFDRMRELDQLRREVARLQGLLGESPG